MQNHQIDAIRRALADLAANPETSFAMYAYLNVASERDIVDVMNEVEVMAQVLRDHDLLGKGSLSSRSS